MRRIWRFVVLLCFVILFVGVCHLYVACKERSVEQAWERIGRPSEDITDRYPAKSLNKAALGLEELVTVLGIRLAPAGVLGRPEAERSKAEALEEVFAQLSSFVRSQIKKGNHPPEAPSERLTRFLTQNEKAVEAVITYTLETEGLWWENDLSLMFDAAVPDAEGQRKLHQVWHCMHSSRLVLESRKILFALCG